MEDGVNAKDWGLRCDWSTTVKLTPLQGCASASRTMLDYNWSSFPSGSTMFYFKPLSLVSAPLAGRANNNTTALYRSLTGGWLTSRFCST